MKMMGKGPHEGPPVLPESPIRLPVIHGEGVCG